MAHNCPRIPTDRPRQGPFWLWLTLGYALLLAYATLYPLENWQTPPYDIWRHLLGQGLRAYSRPDTLINLLAYIPLGLFGARALESRSPRYLGVILITLVGALLSVTLEYSQAFLPARVPSLLDTLLNMAGTLLGALLATLLDTQNRLGRWLTALRQAYIEPGALGNLGLLTLALWGLSQLTPLVPSLDLDNLRQGIKPLWLALQGHAGLDLARTAVYALSVAGMALLATRIIERHRNRILIIGSFVGTVLLLKIPVVSRALSPEALAGVALGALLFLGFRKTRYGPRMSLAAVAIMGAVAIDSLRASGGAFDPTRPFNWIPFRGHLSHELIGFANILEGLWPFLALNLMLQLSRRTPPGWPLRIIGGLGIFCAVFALEWHQQSIPGRFPDITTALIALVGWFLPWFHPSLDLSRSPRPVGQHRARPGQVTHHLTPAVILTALAVTAVCTGIGIIALSGVHPEQPLDESRLPTLPPPGDLPPVNLPGFRYIHPRLPAPSEPQIARIRRENPSYFEVQKDRARDGKGAFFPVILTARVEPGSQDLERLYQRLMDLKFSWRGHQQVKPLALAYDWLYDQWSEQQRERLRTKLIEGAEYLIHRIRVKQRLSPYNVYLYNSPFQALMAATLAVYGDDPDAELPMRWSTDYWKTRVLPVWRQVMGQNGGWHEGGEYVGIGIGQAIYQVPAMWRKATGEDLFQSEPGIRGFLDFLIYRTRPDGTHFHWGDAGFFNRRVPDRIPLSIEYYNAAAYSLNGCPNRIEPTAWPWGPLPDPSLCRPEAIQALPLSRFFDGIGLLVARSSWDPDATYVTFKAGDNYWSHSHLDQGAFTLYKGGALAIDSGLYGTSYGSDHHMNYSYQTIAHNTVTVYDPEDRVPAPDKKAPRPIANDGGQRHVGSGWGVEAAPLDLEEWWQKRAIYHTGEVLEHWNRDGLDVIVADLTPAYTNEYSGEGTFSHRTRRMEDFTRTFAYDRIDDVIVIHDDLSSTEVDFRKHWLLHTIEEPHRTEQGFVAAIKAKNGKGHGGGRLHAYVLLPQENSIQILGGKGFEFFVNGENYDENGQVLANARAKGNDETGAWRVDITPAYAATRDAFLVVLLPTSAGARPGHRIRALKAGQRYGVEIAGPKRTTRWWFDEDHRGPSVEIVAGGQKSTRDLRVARAARAGAGDQGGFARLQRYLDALTGSF